MKAVMGGLVKVSYRHEVGDTAHGARAVRDAIQQLRTSCAALELVIVSDVAHDMTYLDEDGLPSLHQRWVVTSTVVKALHPAEVSE